MAAKQLGFSHVLGIKVIRGEFKSAKGWKLEYIERASTEGMNANVDVRTNKEVRRDLKKELKEQRKARVKEMNLPPRMAHCVMGLNPITKEISVLYPNAYKAEQDLGIKGVYNAALGLNNRLVGGLIWDWLFA